MKNIFKVHSFTDLEKVDGIMNDLAEISTSGLVSENETVIEKGIRADEYMSEIAEVDGLVYEDFTVKVLTRLEYDKLIKRGFYPGFYNGSYVFVFDVYDSCIPNHEEDYMIYLTDPKDV